MALPSRQQFRRSLGNSPMARESDAIYNAAVRGGINPAFVAGLAAAESSYGTAGYARGTYNPFGLGVHLGWRFPNYASATSKLAKTLNEGSYKSLYKNRGLAGIISRYTPASDGNNEGQHFRNIVSYGSKTGGDARQVYVSQGMTPELPAATARAAGGSIDSAALMKIMRQQVANVRSGRGYDRKLGLQLRETIISQINAANARRQQAPAGGGAVDTGDTSGTNLDSLGLGYGGADSHKISKGGEGGNWGGSMERALQFVDWAKQTGYQPNTSGRWISQKRSRRNTASNNVSDHWEGSRTSYAVDLGVPNVQSGDVLLKNLMRQFGAPNYRGGSWLNVNRGGYRYQIGWRTPGHYDHIHVGVKKL
ncbi:MAG: hypothetical protein ACPG9N_00150 [Miltoncostaeaceae bacterium]